MLKIVFVNDGTGDEVVGNYDYRVFVNETLIADGRVEGHIRQTGWRGLITWMANRIEKSESDNA